MRVLGVDLDMLTSTDPFYMPSTPPPSPDSSSSGSTISSSSGSVHFKPNSMTFEFNKIVRSQGNTAHHMACHDYTNKVSNTFVFFVEKFLITLLVLKLFCVGEVLGIS